MHSKHCLPQYLADGNLKLVINLALIQTLDWHFKVVITRILSRKLVVVVMDRHRGQADGRLKVVIKLDLIRKLDWHFKVVITRVLSQKLVVVVMDCRQ